MIETGYGLRAKKTDGMIGTSSILRSNPRRPGLWVAEANWSECVELHVRVDEHPSAVRGKVYRRTDGELSPIAPSGEMRDDLSIVDRQRDGARMGHQYHGWY